MTDALRCSRCGAPLVEAVAGGLCPACLLQLGLGHADADATHLAAGGSASFDSVPDQIGEFRLVRLIGRGGMGSVYEAYQASMHRRVALKVLPAAAAFQADDVTRFEREAWIGGRLNHPNIVKVFSQGVAQGTHYIAMELVEGESLRGGLELAKQRRNAPKDSDTKWRAAHIRRMVSLFVGVADGLHHVHQNGIVHRDIKPGNLLWNHAGDRLLLTDFGLAKDADASRLTAQGDFMGTIRYMSPEQLLAHRAKVDHRSDIWSLGVSLYEALTLDLPYSSPTEEGYIAAVGMKEPAPARKRDAAVPKDLETVLMRCLERDPDRRYQSADELRDDLNRYLEQKPVLARRPGAAVKASRLVRRHPVTTAVTAVAVLALAALGYWIANRSAFYSAIDRTLARLEQEGLRQESTLLPDEQVLRDAFVAGTMRAEQIQRFARLMVKPRVIVSDYVVKKAASEGLRTGVDRIIPPPWGFVIVSRRVVRIEDNVVASDPAPGVSDALPIANEALGSLPTGRHVIHLDVTAWIFDESEHRRVFGRRLADKGGGSVELGTIMNPSSVGAGDDRYGVRDERWDQFWPQMMKRTPPIWSGGVSTSKDFEAVDELPANFPLAVTSSSLDDAMRKALSVAGFYFQPPQICYQLRTLTPVPAPLAGVLEFKTGAGELLGETSVHFSQGQTDTYSTCARAVTRLKPAWELPVLAWSEEHFGSWKTQGASPANMWYRIEHGEKVEVIASFRASRDLAGKVPGLNSYWDGKLEFRGLASPKPPE